MLNTKLLLGAIGVVIVVGALVMVGRSNQEAKSLKAQLEELQKQSPAAAQDEVKKLVEAVGRLIALPEGDTPTLATISDKEKLKDVPFFAKAENGDKVLIYVNTRKAFLYRPSTQKLIEVATLNLNTAAQNQTFAAKVVLRNGTDIAGLTKGFEDALNKGLPKVEVVSRDNAKKTTYADTLIIDLSGTKKEDAQRLATTLGAKVAELPADESKPTGADFLVIIGKNKSTNVAATSPVPTPTPAANATPAPE